jgi:hypothetical protein
MKYRLAGLLLIILHSCSAQFAANLFSIAPAYLHFPDSSAKRPEVTLQGSYLAASNVFTRQLIHGTFAGVAITNQQKFLVLQQLKSTNRFGMNPVLGVQYVQPHRKLKHAAWMLAYSFETITAAQFQPQLAMLLLLGNASLEDVNATLSPFEYRQWTFGKISAGFQWNWNSNREAAAITLGVLQGFHHEEILLSNASLYTAPDGEFLDLQYNLSMATASEGWGVATSAVYRYRFHPRWHLQLRMHDAGFLEWRNGTVSARDTSLHFTGIEVENFLSMNDSILGETWGGDLRAEFLGEPVKTSYRSNLPTRFEVLVQWRPFTKLQDYITVGVSHRASVAASPFGFVQYHAALPSRWSASLITGYGDWSSLFAGFTIQKQWNHWRLGFGIPSLTGLISPRSTGSSAAFLQVAFSLPQSASQ